MWAILAGCIEIWGNFWWLIEFLYYNTLFFAFWVNVMIWTPFISFSCTLHDLRRKYRCSYDCLNLGRIRWSSIASLYEGLIKVICCLLVFSDRQKSTSSYFVFHVNIFFLKGISCERIIWFYGTTWRLCGMWIFM